MLDRLAKQWDTTTTAGAAAWPERVADEAALDDLMTTPDDTLRAALARVDGDIVVLGVGGKMGPTLAGLAKRAAPEKRVVGVLEVVREYYPDPSDKKGRFVMVDFKALDPLATPVTLENIKKDGRLDDIALVRQSRLSVMPIDAAAWATICEMGGIAP